MIPGQQVFKKKIKVGIIHNTMIFKPKRRKRGPWKEKRIEKAKGSKRVSQISTFSLQIILILYISTLKAFAAPSFFSSNFPLSSSPSPFPVDLRFSSSLLFNLLLHPLPIGFTAIHPVGMQKVSILDLILVTLWQLVVSVVLFW